MGSSYSEWSAEWWKWLISIPKNENPVFETSGKVTMNNYIHSNVLFLCQTIESIKPIPHRKINFSFGSSIFMPIINWISISEDKAESDHDLKDLARRKMDSVGNLELFINGMSLPVNLKDYRIESDAFDIVLPTSNIFGLKPGSARAASDGFWVFFKPLVAKIEVESHGSCSAGLTQIGINYLLKAS
jgi:hypothetical protein